MFSFYENQSNAQFNRPLSFEVFLCNKKVCFLVKKTRAIVFYDKFWADVQKLDVEAKDETEALQKNEHRFPTKDDFVVAALNPTMLKL